MQVIMSNIINNIQDQLNGDNPNKYDSPLGIAVPEDVRE
jgi:hypothetical protein